MSEALVEAAQRGEPPRADWSSQPDAPLSRGQRRHPKLCTMAETAALLRIHRSSVYELLNKGDLASLTIGARRFVCDDEIDRFIAGRAAAEAAVRLAERGSAL